MRLRRSCKSLLLLCLKAKPHRACCCPYKQLRQARAYADLVFALRLRRSPKTAALRLEGRTVPMPDKLRKQFGGTVYAIVFIIPWWVGTVWILKILGKLIFR